MNHHHHPRLLAVFAALLPASGCAASPAQSESGYVATATGGMVVSPSPWASQAGAEILRAGGNAVDAAVATSLAIGVTRPYSAGLGGGGFMMVRLAATGEVLVLDYRETAPAAATPRMFVDARAARPDAPPPSRFGGLAVATPGLVAGHAAMLGRCGTRKLAELVQPARRLAAEGFTVDAAFRSVAESAAERYTEHPSLAGTGRYIRQTFLDGGKAPAVGRVIRQPALAAALDAIGREGEDAFYHGPIAAAIARSVRDAGGILTDDDLAAYRPRWREPLRLRYRDRYDLLLMPPPSSGGVVIGAVLNFLEPTDLSALRRTDEGAAAHWLVEAMKHAYADRARWLSDPDAGDAPARAMLDKAYAKRLAARSKPDRTLPPEQYGSTTLPEDGGTAHFCVADRWGNLVACTETINTTFGSFVAADDFGIVLNNEMDDFTAEPGKPNAFKLVQSDRNAPRPGRRPLSSMSPTIVLRDGEPWLAIGAAGGPRIISSVLNVLLARMDAEMTLPDAMRAVRLHHQWQPDEIVASRRLPQPLADDLRRRGHRIADKPGSGHVEALAIEDGRYVGVSDPGKGGAAVGTP